MGRAFASFFPIPKSIFHVYQTWGLKFFELFRHFIFSGTKVLQELNLIAHLREILEFDEVFFRTKLFQAFTKFLFFENWNWKAEQS